MNQSKNTIEVKTEVQRVDETVHMVSDRSGQSTPSFNPSQDLATTPRRQQSEEIPRETLDVQKLQDTVERLERKISMMATSERFNNRGMCEYPTLENSLVKSAKIRLKFDLKNVHYSIESWDNFFRMHGVRSDYDKFFAVEQLLPEHTRRAMYNCMDMTSSYDWLVAYLKDKFEPKYLCYELSNKSLNRFSNMNEVEEMAVEAASSPQEHLVKHFMLEMCSQWQKQRMKPYIFLPLKEFKFKLKMMVSEDTGRYPAGTNGNQPGSSTNNNRFQQQQPAVNSNNNRFQKVRFMSQDDVGTASREPYQPRSENMPSFSPVSPGSHFSQQHAGNDHA